ncbi:MAG: hypothetical protein QOG63_1189 [Thermoleophilaceae bacterium]|jgi:uncharacterized protein YndB with AHSA1/START domain|nr:hypothetical protein [Thermoleophilaceae bacterium]
MARVTRERTISAPSDEVWELVSDPHSFARWWPATVRVEDASPQSWTKVLRTPRGKTVRADFTRSEYEPPRRIAWRQELEESPFERIFSSAVTELELRSAEGGGTVVSLTFDERLRGINRFGGFLLRRASRRRLDEALDGLERAVGRA